MAIDPQQTPDPNNQDAAKDSVTRKGLSGTAIALTVMTFIALSLGSYILFSALGNSNQESSTTAQDSNPSAGEVIGQPNNGDFQPTTQTTTTPQGAPSSTSGPTAAPSPTETNTVATGIIPRPDPSIAEKPNCGQLQTQLEINQCSYDNYGLSDAKLNEIYDYVLSIQNGVAQDSLIETELAWIQFRDGQCEWERSRYEGGSIAPTIFANCMEALTNTRIDELTEPSPGSISYEAADRQLNQVYQDLQSLVAADVGEQILTVQQSWLAYRDTNCIFESNYAEYAIDESQCLARMTQFRTQQLQQELDHQQELGQL